VSTSFAKFELSPPVANDYEPLECLMIYIHPGWTAWPIVLHELLSMCKHRHPRRAAALQEGLAVELSHDSTS